MIFPCVELFPQHQQRRNIMSRFRKLSHTIWHCQYHIVWVPKYRLRILTGKVATEVAKCIRAFSEQLKCEVVELNIQLDHVHLLVLVPPKVSISSYMGTVKGRTAIRVFNKFRDLKKKHIGGIIFGRKATVLIQLG
jgi:putative transposase